jgi:hypothetical protein
MSQINNRPIGAVPRVSLSSRAVCEIGRFEAIGFILEVFAYDRFVTEAGRIRLFQGSFRTRYQPTVCPL